jgi:ribonuclease VapC
MLDASALLTLLQNEPGSGAVAEMLPKAAISAVDMAEVVTKLVKKTGDPRTVVEKLKLLNLRVLPWDESAAYRSGELAHLADKGLSLGDRACLTQAIISNAMAATADKSWKDSQQIADRVILIR